MAAVTIGLLLMACGSPQPVTVTREGTHTIAFLRAVPSSGTLENAFLETLRLEGYLVGGNLEVLASNVEEVYPDPESAEFVIRQWKTQGVDLIVASSTVGARVAESVAPELNTLFVANNPVATGLIDDESNPGGSLTGVTFKVPTDRTLDLVRRAIPGSTQVGLAYPPDDPAAIAHRDEAIISAQELGLTLIVEQFQGPEEVATAVARLAERGAGSLLLSNSPTATALLPETELAARTEGLVAIANSPVAPWAIISLYPDSEEIGRQLGRQAARLLAGSSPSAIPVEPPRRLVLELNSAAAADHGIVFPESMLREAHVVRMP